MRRPLLLCSFCLVVLVAVWYYLGSASVGGGPPDGTRLIVTGRIRQKDEKSFSIYIQSAATLRQDNPIQNEITTGFTEAKLLCECDGTQELILGSLVAVQGDFYTFSRATNPGEFDYAGYYRSLGYAGRLRNTIISDRGTGDAGLWEWLYRLRRFWEERLYHIFPEKEASVMTAILLGDKSGLDEEVKELYQRSGIIHILSISGLHITFIGMGIYKLLRKAGVPVCAASLSGAVVLVLYGMMTGLGVSVCRAIGMYLLRMMAHMVGRTYDMPTALGVVAAGMVLFRPAWLGHMGFLLSFGSVLGVGILLPALIRQTGEEVLKPEHYVEGRWRQRLLKWRDALWKGARQGFLAGFAITVTTLPIQLWFSYEIPVYSLFLNVLVLPFMSAVLVAGLLAMLVPGLGVAGMVDVAILAGYEWLCRIFEKFPCSVWNPGRPEVWQVVVYYLLWVAAVWGAGWMGNSISGHWSQIGKMICGKIICNKMTGQCRRIKQKSAVRDGSGIGCTRLVQLILLGTAVLIVGISPSPGDKVTFLDVGQGDCICVQLDSGAVYLFDCGSSSRSHVGERVLIPFLKYQGIRRVDAVFLSHADADHINGAMELLELYEKEQISIGQLVLPGINGRLWQEEFGEILEAAGHRGSPATGNEDPGDSGDRDVRSGIPVTVIRAGEGWRVGEDSFLCLHPSSRGNSMGGNAGSECFYIELREGDNRISLLLTGDVEGAGETELLAQLKDRGIRDVTVLKVAHHGSKNSTSAELLEQINPGFAVISCGRNNRYGHPHAELLERLEAEGSTVVSTARSGAVELRVSESKAKLHIWLGED